MAPEGGEAQQQMQLQTPTSWRDVYQLVQDSEKRMTAIINEGFARASGISADHEVRIRVLEKTDQNQAGGVAVIGAGRALLITIISVGSFILAAASLVAHT
jgi:hypothetical protein